MTFFEIASLSEGRRILSLKADGVSPAEEAMLNKMAAALE